MIFGQTSRTLVRHAVVIVGFLAAPAFGVIIDDFSVGPITLTVDNDNPFAEEQQTGLDPTTVIGGNRRILLYLDALGEVRQGMIAIDTSTQSFHFKIDGFLETHGVSWGSGGLLNADLTADANNAFEIALIANAVPLTLTLALVSGINEEARERNSASVVMPASAVPLSVRIPFLEFPDVDFTDIDSIGFWIPDARPGTDLTLDAIRTVPEPSTLAMLILGLIGIMWMVAKADRLTRARWRA